MLFLFHHYRFISVNPADTFVISPSLVFTSPDSIVLPFILILAEFSFKSNPFGIISFIFTLFIVVPGTKLFIFTVYVTTSPTLYSNLSTLFCISILGSFTFIVLLVFPVSRFPCNTFSCSCYII